MSYFKGIVDTKPLASNPLYLDPDGNLRRGDCQVEVLEQRNAALVRELTRALTSVHELTQELLEARR